MGSSVACCSRLQAPIATDADWSTFQTLAFDASFADVVRVDFSRGMWIGTMGLGYARQGYDNIVIAPDPLPEPGTIALLGLGVLGLAYRRRRNAESGTPWLGTVGGDRVR